MSTTDYITDDGEIIKAPFLRTPYNYNTITDAIRTGLECDPQEDKAVQDEAESCDINIILERFGVTGLIPQRTATPLTGDYIEAVTDFQTAMNLTVQARESFNELPAKVRARFSNDPQLFLEFVMNDENQAEAEKLGILTTKTPAKPEPTPKPPEGETT